MKNLLLWTALAVTTFAESAKAEALTQSEVRKLFPGNYTVLIFGRYDLNVNMRSNGTISGVAGKYRDTGKWSVENGKLCVAWSSWTNGKKGCSALTRKGNWVSGRGFRFLVS